MTLRFAAIAAFSAFAALAPAAHAASYNTLTGEAPLVVAHRGASGYLPEETLGGYELAIKLGADYIEPDLQLTKDGHLVAMHDGTLSRTTDVRDLFPDRSSYSVGDFTLAEIKTLTVKPTGALSGDKNPHKDFTPSMADPYKVPTFEEVLDYLTAYNTANGTSIGIYPESKAPFDAVKDAAIIKTLKDKGYTAAADKVILQSFDNKSILELDRLLGENGMEAELAQLGSVSLLDDVYSVGGVSLADLAKVADGVGVSYGGITEAFIKAAHDLGLKVHAYTFRPLSEEQAFAMIEPMLNWGLDGFFTDYTDFGRAVVDAQQPAPVPLPAAAPLLLAGLGGLALLRRRKKAA
ncbi:glycerophosphodiester phosphodiesterase family protein [Paracoccus sp. S3-43]|uniref:glycerophosphodiester phosphodiesterase family protein n=1 Tax=Paracoccus sp. S3-43 TaxID=3030011 RepID=UPI0023B0AA5A|nr:glycerophosphodiester phosphodiesterase family protein [Paracoccus sp. S3-43]WEF24084.1 VPLPA-CTERM sorting domain-containing protein [Paracoccus sp. S3-43]